MLDRQKTILTAAFTVFSRYGFKRATMNDIASEAGVARQTLYNAFANKETLLKALTQSHIDETCQALRVQMESNATLDESLELAFDHFARKPFDLLINTPHGGEILEALENSASEEMNESKQRFTHGIEALLHVHAKKGVSDDLTPKLLADFIVHTAMGHKAKATSRAHLDTLLATLKVLVLDAVK